MIEHGAGSRWSMLVLGALAVFGGLAGCLASDDDSKVTRAAAEVSVERSSDEPQQVVQRNLADPTGARSGLTASSAGAARLSAAGVARAVAEPRSSVGEPITSKHLEAELNRLEAELGN